MLIKIILLVRIKLLYKLTVFLDWNSYLQLFITTSLNYNFWNGVVGYNSSALKITLLTVTFESESIKQVPGNQMFLCFTHDKLLIETENIQSKNLVSGTISRFFPLRLRYFSSMQVFNKPIWFIYCWILLCHRLYKASFQ